MPHIFMLLRRRSSGALRLRVQQSELMDKMATALGADPVRLSYLRIPTALSTRLIDGAEGNWPAFMIGGHL
jgi:TRAP-type C4-dicarboxylate transport system substrate-binding protein